MRWCEVTAAAAAVTIDGGPGAGCDTVEVRLRVLLVELVLGGTQKPNTETLAAGGVTDTAAMLAPRERAAVREEVPVVRKGGLLLPQPIPSLSPDPAETAPQRFAAAAPADVLNVPPCTPAPTGPPFPREHATASTAAVVRLVGSRATGDSPPIDICGLEPIIGLELATPPPKPRPSIEAKPLLLAPNGLARELNGDPTSRGLAAPLPSMAAFPMLTAPVKDE